MSTFFCGSTCVGLFLSLSGEIHGKVIEAGSSRELHMGRWRVLVVASDSGAEVSVRQQPLGLVWKVLAVAVGVAIGLFAWILS